MENSLGLPAEFRINTTIGLSIIIGGLFNTGMVYQQFQQIKEEQKNNAATVTSIRETQMNGLASIGGLKIEQALQAGRLEGLDKRLNVIENHLVPKVKK